MQLVLTSFILLLSCWLTVANPVIPVLSSDNIEIILKNQISTTLNSTPFPTDVPTPPPEGCLTPNGSVPVGTDYNEGECKHCKCINDGKSECFTIDCEKIQCVDGTYIQGKCCPLCLNGFNCRMPDGTILEKGTQLHTMNMTCECADMEDSWEEPVAHCIYTL